jgi:hypothetical protein
MSFEKHIVFVQKGGGFRENVFGKPAKQQLAFFCGSFPDLEYDFGKPAETDGPHWVYPYDGLIIYLSRNFSVESFYFDVPKASVATEEGVNGSFNPREVRRIYEKQGTVDVDDRPGHILSHIYYIKSTPKDPPCDIQFRWSVDRTQLLSIEVSSNDWPPYRRPHVRPREADVHSPLVLPRSFAGDAPLATASGMLGAAGAALFDAPPRRSAIFFSHVLRLGYTFDPPAPLEDVSQTWQSYRLSPAPDLLDTKEASDALAAELHAEAKALYGTANAAYRKMDGRKRDYIAITSGLRSTARQAELYIAYIAHLYGGPTASRANKPGASNHEYGLAIDVTRSLDEKRFQTALTEAGWTNDLADEGWHFDAVAIPAWSSFQKRIAQVLKDHSEPFAKDVADQFEFEKLIKEHTPKFNEAVARLARLQSEIAAAEQVLARDQSRLAAEQQQLRVEQSNLRSREAALEEKRASYQRLRFQCPNGRSFEQCDHDDLKRDFAQRRDRLRSELESMQNVVRERQQQFAARTERFNRDVADWQRRSSDVDRQRRQVQPATAALEEYRERLARWTVRRDAIVADRPSKLAAIEAAVRAVRAGKDDGPDT